MAKYNYPGPAEKHEKLVLVSKDGKRMDGRSLDELRPIVAKAGILKKADGSGYFAFGRTRAIAGVFFPKPVYPRFMEKQDRAILKTHYAMAPFSTTTRINPGSSRRGTEISFVIKSALESVIMVEEFPKTMIEIYIEILQADASTRCAALNAAAMALADAGIPMKDIVTSCSVGKIDGHIAADIAGKEDEEGEVDLPVAYFPRKKQIVLMQMDGVVTEEELKKAVSMAKVNCEKINDIQKAALKEKYLNVEVDINQ
jgi:exosome complex component RRP41